MLLKIDFESETPIYLQLRNQIIEAIALKHVSLGESLPSVRQLAEDIGINMHTVNKAYSVLKNDGFVRMDLRKGAVISSEGNKVTNSYLIQLKGQLNDLIAEAYCREYSKDEFLKSCSDIFEIYRGSDKL